MNRRILDIVLYGGVLAIAVGAGAWAIVNRETDLPEQPRTIASPAPEPGEPERHEGPRIVPHLPEVPDLATEPPPARPAEGDPRMEQLTAEMRIVSRARELLAGHHPGDALAVLEDHQSRYADGVLREEREAFAIEALVALERRPEAERRYYDFSRTYPQSDFSSRLATLMR